MSIVPVQNALGINEAEYSTLKAQYDIVNVIIVFYAGYAAQVRYNPGCCDRRRANSADEDEKFELLALLLAESAPVLEEMRNQATQLVADNWTAVEVLAGELLRSKQISSEEAELILKAVYGGKEEKRELEEYRVFLNACKEAARTQAP